MASTDACPIAGMADEARRFYAVQFHPEVTHTVQGAAILSALRHDICGCGRRLEHARLRRRGGREASARRSAATKSFSAFPAASIRSVAAALIHRAIGDQLTCVFVDHGLLRLNEAEQVMADLRPEPRRQGDPRRCQRRSSWASSPASPTRSRSARSSAANSSKCSRREAAKLHATRNGWRRARSTRT